MEILTWKNITLNGNPQQLDNLQSPVEVRKIVCGEYCGSAYYISLEDGRGIDGEKTAILVPQISDTDKFMAIERHVSCWTRPFWGDSLSKLPTHVQELVVEESGIYYAFLPVCDSILKTEICGCPDGISFVLSSNKTGLKRIPKQLSFVMMYGKTATGALKSAAKMAAELLENGLKMRSERTCPDVFNYLGWCSWDAFQIRVNHQGLVEKAKELKDKQIPIHYAVVDDMWADVPHLNEIPSDIGFREMVNEMHASKLRTFEGDPVRFPEGMTKTVEAIKSEGIPNVGIWFPVTGYWFGLDENGQMSKELEDCVAMSAQNRLTVIPEKQKAQKYFDYMCQKVKQWGADFVKIDNQGFYANFKDMYTFGEAEEAVQGAIDCSAEKYFNGALINCMGMPSECLFHRTKSAVCRCSEDFKPESREWFAKNILQCSYNGLLQGQYLINDWDMWWTDDAQAVKNSLCRAISGGPIYLSDKLGRTRSDVLSPLMLRDGRILRPDNSAIPSEDCIMENPTKTQKIFKLINRFADNGVMAVFNLNAENKKCKGSVSPLDCELPNQKYAWYEFFSQNWGVLEAGDVLQVTLDTNDDFKLYTFVPFTNGCAVMGRIDLFMGVGAVLKNGKEISFAESGTVAEIYEATGKIKFINANN